MVKGGHQDGPYPTRTMYGLTRRGSEDSLLETQPWHSGTADVYKQGRQPSQETPDGT